MRRDQEAKVVKLAADMEAAIGKRLGPLGFRVGVHRQHPTATVCGVHTFTADFCVMEPEKRQRMRSDRSLLASFACKSEDVTFETVDAYPRSIHVGQRFNNSLAMSDADLLEEWEFMRRQSANWTERHAAHFARASVIELMRLLAEELPEAPKQDWRPEQAIPEDFHAG
jgi:hypothetical protein